MPMPMGMTLTRRDRIVMMVLMMIVVAMVVFMIEHRVGMRMRVPLTEM